MSERSNLISAEDIRELLEDIDHKDAMQSTKEQDEQSSPFLAAASVMAFYDPQTIEPFGGKHSLTGDMDHYKNILIGRSEIVANTKVTDGEKGEFKKSKILFRLKDEFRRTALKLLLDENKVSEAIEINRNVLDFNSPTQYLFTHCLEGHKVNFSKLNFEELSALHEVVGWLEGLQPAVHLPSRPAIVRQMEVVEMLSPFRHLTGTYQKNGFKESFKGRKSELSTLRRYAGVAAPKGFSERIGRIVGSLLSEEKKPLFIFGPGGVGKSTLLAKFLLEHAEAQQKYRFPFVYLDFDRPNLSALDTDTLIVESARQLAVQYLDDESISTQLLNFHKKWIGAYLSLTGTSGTSQINLESVEGSINKQQQRDSIRAEFIVLIKMVYEKDNKPFLMILDTFEEVQYKGSEFVDEVLDFLSYMQLSIPKLRVVIAGRAPIDKTSTTELELGDLDSEAARAFLIAKGVTRLQAMKVSSIVGGNPLSLKLAAELVNKYGLEELSTVNTNKNFFKRRPELEIQGMLYNRILKHLHSADAKKIAHPGLVLRKITPDLILGVLAVPCQLDVKTSEDARLLFDELAREVSLVTKQGQDTLRHRPDVRKVMLRLVMESDKREQALEIHRLAIDYYSKKDSLNDRAEEFYHQLAFGVSPRQLESRWIDGIEDYLAGNIDELPEKAQAFLLAKMGIESSNSALWDMADAEDKVRHVTKQAASLLNSGLAQRALNLLAQESSHEFDPVMKVIEVRALLQLNKYSEAALVSTKALKSFYADQLPSSIKVELNKYAMGFPPKQKNTGGLSEFGPGIGYWEGPDQENDQKSSREGFGFTSFEV